MVTTTPVTIEQAAAILGVSASTIRRRIRAGALQVTETHRPQGTVWLVHLPSGVTPAAEAATVDTAPVDTVLTAQPTPALAQADALASLIQATLTPIIAPLVGELAASRQVNERLTDQLMSQADTIAELREERGRLSTALAAEREKSSLEARTAAQVSLQSHPRPYGACGARWWPVVAILVPWVVIAGLVVWLR